MCCPKLTEKIKTIVNQSGGSGGIVLTAPDYATQTAVLSANGTWTATQNGFVQHAFEITADSNYYKSITTINGNVVNSLTVATLSSGIYDGNSPIMPVMADDIITVSLTYSTGTIVNYNNLYFYPLRN